MKIVRLVAALAAAPILTSCAVVAFYERHTKPLPCELNLCTAEQWAEQDRLPTIPVDLGPHLAGRVVVAAR